MGWLLARAGLTLALLWGCSPATADPGAHFVLVGGRLPGGARADVEVLDGRIARVGDGATAPERVDVTDRWLAPAFVDSHVHLTYLPVHQELADAGVALAVDLAAPIGALATGRTSGPRVLGSGPMVTAIGGYPTRSWGAGGYGIECADADAAVAAVERVHGAGAKLVKLPLAGAPQLDQVALRAAVDRAHALGLVVVSHALDDASARLAADVGVDALAHTPTSRLSDATVAAWAGRTVISTLRAFGGSATTVDNLRRLRQAGARVLYGTDLGNTRDARIDPSELALLTDAGLDGGAILAAGTSAPAAFWGQRDLGALAAGRAASLLVLDADPTVDPTTLSRPVSVYLDGRPR